MEKKKIVKSRDKEKDSGDREGEMIRKRKETKRIEWNG